MLHPHTELRHVNDRIGYGIFATRRIPKGTITWVRDDLDQTFTLEEIGQFTPEYQEILEKYCFIDRNGKAVLCWDLARFMNHSCEANCIGAGYEFEVAVRDIEKGEELTDDYGTLNLLESFPCLCGRSGCRKVVEPDDLMRYWEGWDEQLRSAFACITELEQPLKGFLRSPVELQEATADPSKMRSCRFNYYPQVLQRQPRRRAAV
jgi:hypothetical protein